MVVECLLSMTFLEAGTGKPNSELNLKIVLYHVVSLDPPIHMYSQDFPSFLFADQYTSLLLNVKFSVIYRFNSSPCLTSLSCIYFFKSTGEKSEVACGWCVMRLFEENGAPVPNK